MALAGSMEDRVKADGYKIGGPVKVFVRNTLAFNGSVYGPGWVDGILSGVMDQFAPDIYRVDFYDRDARVGQSMFPPDALKKC